MSYRRLVQEAAEAEWNRGELDRVPEFYRVRDFMLVRIEAGRIAEQWGLVDTYSMYVQLGLIEPRRRPGR